MLVIVSTMLQWDPTAQKDTNNCHLLGRHLQHWKEHCFENHVAKTETSAGQIS